MQNPKELNMQNNEELRGSPAEPKEPWQPMSIDYVGNVSELVLGGAGKNSTTPADPGEPRKTIPSG
jgi:hypothetical protein